MPTSVIKSALVQQHNQRYSCIKENGWSNLFKFICSVFLNALNFSFILTIDKTINAMIIASSDNLGDLLRLCETNGHSFSNVNLITSLHRISKLLQHDQSKNLIPNAKHVVGTFVDRIRIEILTSQDISNLMWSLAKIRINMDRRLADDVSKRSVVTAGQFKPQGVANLMWAFATLGMEPGEELAGAMSRRAVATAGQFTPQNVANLMWAFAVLSFEPGLDLALVFSSFLYAGAFTRQDQLSQLHQCFLCMELEGFLQGACDPVQHAGFTARCRRAFEAGPTPASGLEYAVRRRLSDMGVGWVAGVREQRTGYSLDLVLEGFTGPVALEVDGPWHFLVPVSKGGQGRREQGATVLKRRLLERAGWRMANVRYWEWDEASAAGTDMEQAYLEWLLAPHRLKLYSSPRGAPPDRLQHSPPIAPPISRPWNVPLHFYDFSSVPSPQPPTHLSLKFLPSLASSISQACSLQVLSPSRPTLHPTNHARAVAALSAIARPSAVDCSASLRLHGCGWPSGPPLVWRRWRRRALAS